MSDIDNIINSKDPSVVMSVAVVHLSERIGSARLFAEPGLILISGTYRWPPGAGSEQRFKVYWKAITQEETCNVEINWPMLLPRPIPETTANYRELLVLGQPSEEIIWTSTGDRVGIGLMYQSPNSSKLKTIRVGVTEVNASASLLFIRE